MPFQFLSQTTSSYKIVHTGFLGACILIISSCFSAGISTDDLQGRWTVAEAYRNGKLTTTLEDGFFEFENDTIFRTNIFSQDLSFNYQLTPSGLEQSGEIVLTYEIESFDSDTLILQTQINNYIFRFITVKDSLTSDLPIR